MIVDSLESFGWKAQQLSAPSIVLLDIGEPSACTALFRSWSPNVLMHTAWGGDVSTPDFRVGGSPGWVEEMPQMHTYKAHNVIPRRIEMGSRRYCSAQCASHEGASMHEGPDYPRLAWGQGSPVDTWVGPN